MSRIRQHLTASKDFVSQPYHAVIFLLGGQGMRAIDLLEARKAAHLWVAGMRYGDANGRLDEWAMENLE